jgi:hypothetical protein
MTYPQGSMTLHLTVPQSAMLNSSAPPAVPWGPCTDLRGVVQFTCSGERP